GGEERTEGGTPMRTWTCGELRKVEEAEEMELAARGPDGALGNPVGGAREMCGSPTDRMRPTQRGARRYTTAARPSAAGAAAFNRRRRPHSPRRTRAPAA